MSKTTDEVKSEAIVMLRKLSLDIASGRVQLRGLNIVNEFRDTYGRHGLTAKEPSGDKTITLHLYDHGER